MIRERHQVSKESSQPLVQAVAAMDGASDQLKTLKEAILSYESQLGRIRKQLEVLEVNARGRDSTADLGAVIEMSREVLEAFQDFEADSVMAYAARHVAKGLAILYVLQNSRTTATKPVPKRAVPAQKPAAPKLEPKPAAPEPTPQHILERRATPRAAVEAEIGFQSDTNFYTGLAEDISTGGIFLATFNIRPIGSLINVNFTLPGGHFISVDGQVRWIREFNEMVPDLSPGMGIQFEKLCSDDKYAIDDFVKQRSTLFYDDE